MYDLNKIEICPICHRETLWGEMIWLDGVCTCPSCYMVRKENREQYRVQVSEKN